SAPQSILGPRQVLAAARWTNVLIVRAVGKLILNTECLLHGLQIAYLQLRSVRLAAANAVGWTAFFPGAFVEVDAHLRRTLEDVKELPERKIEQRQDHRHCMQLREQPVVQSAHQVC